MQHACKSLRHNVCAGEHYPPAQAQMTSGQLVGSNSSGLGCQRLASEACRQCPKAANPGSQKRLVKHQACPKARWHCRERERERARLLARPGLPEGSCIRLGWLARRARLG